MRSHFGCVSGVDELERLDLPVEQRIFAQGTQALYAIIYGTGVGGLGIFVARKIRGIPFPVHPGHWILLRAGILMVLGLVSWATIRLLVPQ